MKLVWDIDPTLVHLWGPLEIRYYGALFSCVFVGGYLLWLWQVRRGGGTEDQAFDLIIPGVLGVVVGARLGHIIFYQTSRLWEDPLWTLKIWEGGLASHGAAVGLLAAGLWFVRRSGQSYLETADRFTFSAALGATLIRIGNFFNSEIVGRVTDQTWGVRFPRYDGPPPETAPLRHPSQIYEAGLGLLVLAALLWADRRFGKEDRPRGLLTGVMLTLYFTGRFVVEFFKEPHVLHESMLTMGQILSLPAAAAGAVLLWYSITRGRPAHWNPPPEPARPQKTKSAGKKKRKR